MSNFGGFKDVEWNATGVAFPGTSLGRLKSDSEHNVESATEEDSQGLEVWAGEDESYTIRVYDLSKYAALRAIAVTDNNIVDLRFTDLEDTQVIKSGFSVIVKQPTSFATKSRNYFEARFKRYIIT